MNAIRPIRTEPDYEQALEEIDRCLDAEPGSLERERLEVLSILVDDYESKHHPIPPPDPIAAIQFVLEQQGLTRKDLEDLIGGSGRVSEVMNRKRPLSLPMIRKLVARFGIPAEVLIRSTNLSTAQASTVEARPTRQARLVRQARRRKVQPIAG